MRATKAAQQLQTPGKIYRELLAVVYKRLAEEWEIAAGWDDCRALWPQRARLAGISRHRRRARSISSSTTSS